MREQREYMCCVCIDTGVAAVCICVSDRVQHSATYVKKIIEDNNPVDDTVRFLGVSYVTSLLNRL